MLDFSVANPKVPSTQELVDVNRQVAVHKPLNPNTTDSPILVLSRAIEGVNPLDVLEQFRRGNKGDRLPYFYWEHLGDGGAFLGWGVAAQCVIHQGDRFQQGKQWIKRCQQLFIHHGTHAEKSSSPYFFCNFSFADREKITGTTPPRCRIILPEWVILKQQNHCYLIASFRLQDKDKTAQIQGHLRQFQAMVSRLQGQPQTPIAPPSPLVSPWEDGPLSAIASPQGDFQAGVHHCLQLIQQQQLEKIVLAHSFDFLLHRPLNLGSTLAQLRHHYQRCYLFACNYPQNQVFFGASPERLLTLRRGRLFTDALAGTISRGKNAKEDQTLGEQLRHSVKDNREHDTVVRFLVDTLRSLGLNPQTSERKLLKLSEIQHLWTEISAALPQHLHSFDLLKKLHPTPAVAGVPQRLACEKIQQCEGRSRGLYAAPIGWLDQEGNGEFVVGIRSALWEKEKLRCYAGAGIVAGSEPEKEYREIELKLRSLLKFLVFD